MGFICRKQFLRHLDIDFKFLKKFFLLECSVFRGPGPVPAGPWPRVFLLAPAPAGEIENFTKMICIESMSKALKIYFEAIEHYHHLFISL